MPTKRLVGAGLLLLGLLSSAHAQVGIGTVTPNAAAILDLSSTNRGLLLPRLTGGSSISTPTDGLLIYNSTNTQLQYYAGAWRSVMVNPLTATGDLVVAVDNVGTPGRLSIGATGQLLQVNALGMPAWVTLTSLLDSGTPTGAVLYNTGSGIGGNTAFVYTGAQVGIGGAALPDTRLTVVGLGNTSATTPLMVVNGAGQPVLAAGDDQRVSIGMPGGNATQLLDINGGLSVRGGVIQRGGAGTLAATTDLGLYSRDPAFWMRFVTNGGPFHWYVDGEAGTTPVMRLSETGQLAIGGSTATASNTALAVRRGSGASVFGDAVARFIHSSANGLALFAESNSTGEDGSALIYAQASLAGVYPDIPGAPADANIGVWGWVPGNGAGGWGIASGYGGSSMGTAVNWVRLSGGNAAAIFGGSVGINDENPTQALTMGNGNRIRLKSPAGTAYDLLVDGTTTFGVSYNGSAPDFQMNGANTQLGKGFASSGTRLEVGVSGDGSNARANAWLNFSDSTLKTNVATIQDALELVAQLRGVRFNWKRSGAPSIGFIAQEVDRVLPELVTRGEDGILGLDYPKLTALLVEALKAQQAMLDKQAARLQQLDDRLNAVEARLRN